MAGSGKPFIVKVSPARSRKFLGFSAFRLVRQPNKTRLPLPHFGGFWYITGMAVPEPKRRWFHPTPGHLLLVLLAIEGILFFADWQWIPKGWAVLIAVAAVGVFLIGMLLWFALALVFRWRFQFSIRSLVDADGGGGDSVLVVGSGDEKGEGAEGDMGGNTSRLVARHNILIQEKKCEKCQFEDNRRRTKMVIKTLGGDFFHD